MAFFCFKCSEKLDLSASSIGRRDSCPKCHTDLHCCRNCRHHDLKAYNECHEPQAERVLEKDRSNYCDYFSFSNREQAKVDDQKKDQLKKLDDLFK